MRCRLTHSTSTSIKATVSVDVPHYHVPLAIELLRGTYLEYKIKQVIEVIFGSSREEQLSMSPANFLINNSYVKPALIISAGLKDGQKQTVSWPSSVFYKNELIKNNHIAFHYHFDERSHTSLLNGNEEDEVTKAISQFLDEVFIPSGEENLKAASLTYEEELQLRANIFSTISNNFNNTTFTPGTIYNYISSPVSMTVSCGLSSSFSGQMTSPRFSNYFSIGSLTKLFTGLYLAKLVTDGELSLSTPISDLLPISIPSGSYSNSITLQRLVTHTAGLDAMPANTFSPRDLNGDGVNDSINPLNPAENYSVEGLNLCYSVSSSDPWSRCQSRPLSIGTYLYSNYSIGLLGLGLQIQSTVLYPSFSRLYRGQFIVPLQMDESFGEADDIKALLKILSEKDQSNADIILAINTIKQSFVGIHNYTSPTDSIPDEAPQPDMGILAGAGEIKSSSSSLSKYLRLMLGYEKSTYYSSSVIDEAHRSLFANDTVNLSYALEIETTTGGNLIYKKTGATKGSASYITWSRTKGSGLFVLANRNPTNTFNDDAHLLYESLSNLTDAP